MVALQYGLRLLEVAEVHEVPWELPGRIFTAIDLESVAELPLHRAVCATYQLRLAVLFDAPIAIQQQIVDDNWDSYPAVAGLVYSAEFAFLAGTVLIRSGSSNSRLETVYADLTTLGETCERNL
jgi:hypothetical protein